MSNEWRGTIWVCMDCYFLHCNGEWNKDADRLPLNLIGDDYTITAGMVAEDHHEECFGLSEDCACEHNPFSWTSCEGCGSNLGGMRFAMTLWSAEASATQQNDKADV